MIHSHSDYDNFSRRELLEEIQTLKCAYGFVNRSSLPLETVMAMLKAPVFWNIEYDPQARPF